MIYKDVSWTSNFIQNCSFICYWTLRISSLATLSCRGRVNELATEPFLHSEHGTGYQWSWNCCDRWTQISSWSDNIAVSFCLRAPRYGLTLWCALGLLVGSAIEVPQLQLQLQCVRRSVASRHCYSTSFSYYLPRRDNHTQHTCL